MINVLNQNRIVLQAVQYGQGVLVQYAQQHSMSLLHAQGQAIDNALHSQFVLLGPSTRHRPRPQLKTGYARTAILPAAPQLNMRHHLALAPQTGNAQPARRRFARLHNMKKSHAME
jgi:hypothetical protein